MNTTTPRFSKAILRAVLLAAALVLTASAARPAFAVDIADPTGTGSPGDSSWATGQDDSNPSEEAPSDDGQNGGGDSGNEPSSGDNHAGAEGDGGTPGDGPVCTNDPTCDVGDPYKSQTGGDEGMGDLCQRLLQSCKDDGRLFAPDCLRHAFLCSPKGFDDPTWP